MLSKFYRAINLPFHPSIAISLLAQKWVPVGIFLLLMIGERSYGQCVSLTTLGSASTQSFNTLSNTAGSTTNNLTITGWFMTESGGGARDNEQYAVDNGGSTTGDTYSFGAAAATDRALGGLRSGTLIPVFGSCFTNNTGSTIASLTIAYTGEEWRLGTDSRTDQLDFQYSLNATSLVTGTWTDVNALDFITPNTAAPAGAKDGNAAAFRTALSTTISGLSIPNGATFWIRWNDSDATGADDGLAVDDFSLTPNGAAAPPDYTITTAGNAIIITDDAGNGETLAVSESGGNIRFVVTPTIRTYSINGGPTTAFTTPADVALAGANSITINTEVGADIINIGAFAAMLPSLTVNGGTGDDVVNFNGDLTFAANANLDVDLQNDDATPGVDQINILTDDNILLSGSGSALMTASRSIFFNNNASIETQNGSLTLQANQQTVASPGNFIGINLLSGTIIRSVNGIVSLAGRGGTDSNGIQYGIENRGTIATTGTGNVLLYGDGGPAGNDNDGVRNIGAISATGNGNIQITGTSPTSASSEAFANQPGSTVTATLGDITINADIIYIDPTSSVSAGSNTVFIAPTTVGRLINLGSDDTATQLGLIDAELDRITAGTLVIGNAMSGAITVSANITRSAATNMQLLSNSDITTTGGGINTTGGTLLLDPGASTAAVKPTFTGTDATASTLSFGSGSDLAIVINGTTPGSDYHQLTVSGGVNINGVALKLSGSYVSVGGETFTIVDNSGPDVVIGIFNGLAEGATISNFLGSGLDAQITYTGGDGNDVVLTVVGPPDYIITTTGNAIVITDVSGNGETLDVSESGSNINFNVAGRTYSLDGGATTAFPVNVLLAGANSITINAEDGNDFIYIGAFTANLPSLTINGGTGDDLLNFNGDITFVANAHLDVDMQNDDAIPGVDQVTVMPNANLILFGTGTATVRVSRYVEINSGSSIETATGNLTVEANQQPTPTIGSFYGILINGGALKTSGSGTVTVMGRGGSDAVGGQKGIYVLNSGQISGGTSGAVLVTGTGGPSAGNFNDGIFVDANGAITSLGGNVSVTGLGNGTGSSETHFGVFVRSGGQITAGGTGSVTVHGTGAATAGSNNRGIVVFNTNARITSSGGNVSVTGQGGGTGSSGANWGVYLLNAGQITAGGSGTVTVNGTGGAFSGDSNYGVFIEGANARITSSSGAVSVTGQGGGSGASGSNYGTFVQSGGQITAGGSGTVTVQGTGGAASGTNNYGVFANGANAITSPGGNVSITGQGTGSAADIITQSGGTITSTSTTAGITLNSTNNGTWPNTAGTDVSTTATQKTTFGAGSKLNIDIDGLTVNTQYQQLGVVGMIDLNGASLTFAGSSFSPTAGNTFTIVANDGTDPVIGTFTGLPQGASIPNFLGSMLSAIISYTGGTGNDVILTVVNNVVCYADTDGDGFGDPNNSMTFAGSCGTGFVSDNTDCNDNNEDINPGATEICDGIDNDCDTQIDEGLTFITYYTDADGDGYGTGAGQSLCENPGPGFATLNGDCNDNNDDINPGATEICDGIDNDCDTQIDEGLTFITYYTDADGDGYGTGAGQSLCANPGPGFATLNGDCNDNDDEINPAATEICNGVDDDCDTQVDETGQGETFYADADGDGFGNPAVSVQACTAPQGYVLDNTDCNDNNAAINPAAAEICDGLDNNCNGQVDEPKPIGGAWSNSDVGAPGVNGSASISCNDGSEVINISANGFSTSSSDKLHLVYQTLCGNGEIIARVLNVQNGGWAGITLRETLMPGSKKVALKTQLSSVIRREIRSMTNGPASILNFNRPTHVWLRLVRNGGNFTGYTSVNGTTWSFAFAATVSMGGCLYAGLFAESINANVTTNASFGNISIIGGTPQLSATPQPASALDGLTVSVYPNPSNGEMTLSVAGAPERNLQLEVTDVMGRIVRNVELPEGAMFTYPLNLSNEPAGVYYLRLRSESGVESVQRVVVQQ